MRVQDYGIQNMLWSKNNINIFNSSIVGIAMFCGSCINGLYAQDKIKVDVYANLYLSGNTTIGNVLEELVVGYHMPDNSFYWRMFYAFWCGKSFLWRNAQLFVRESVGEFFSACSEHRDWFPVWTLFREYYSDQIHCGFWGRVKTMVWS